MDNKLHILQHALGLDAFGEGRRYRNHFVTGEGSSDFGDCCALVADGLMTQHPGNELSGGDSVFAVTRDGIAYVEANSPRRPPAPKLTRSQQRYRNWLRADCGISFAEWLGVECRHAVGSRT